MKNNESSNIPPSPYISYYGMVREPFGQTVEDDLFYPESNRKQRLDILLHLTQFGNEIMLVTGPAGSGKTTLLQRFQAKALDTWSVARIEASIGIDERQMLQQLYHQMGMEFQGATHIELLEHMERHFDTLQRSGRLAVMLVDDADQLSIIALKNLLELAALTNTENKPLLRIVLFGATELGQHFTDPQLGHLGNLARRNLDLPPFEAEDTEHYILHRLSAARFAATEPFTVGAMHKIHKQSRGWPGRINDLAHHLLMDTLPPVPVEPDPALKDIPDTSAFPVGRALTVAVFVVIVGGLLIFQEQINQWFEPAEPASMPLALPAMTESESTINKAEKIDETAPRPTTEPELDSAIAALVNDSDDSGHPDTNKAPPDTSQTNTTQPAVPAAPPTVVASSPAPMKQPTAAASEETPQPRRAVVKAGPQPDNLPSRREDWLLAQNPGHYTLQIVAGAQVTTIAKFITEHNFSNDPSADLAFYVSQRNGKPWYGLVLGLYPDKKSAIDARAKLPHELRRLKPWVRNLQGVHKDIQRAQR